MIKSKRILSMLLVVLTLLTMVSTISVGTVVAADNTDKFIFRPFKVLDSAPRASTTVKTGVVFICNADSWVKAKDGEFVYIDYGVKSGAPAECYKLIKGENAFSDVETALSKSSTATEFKLGPGTYNTKVKVSRDGLTFYGNYAGVNPNVDFNNLSSFNEVPQNPERADDSLETIITNTWNWQKTTSYITCDGFTLSEKGQFFSSFSGGNCTNNEFYNIIFKGSTTYGINCDYGTNYNTVIKHCRIVDCTSQVLLFGGAFFNLDLQYNYFAGNTNKYIRFTSIGNNNSVESLLNISNNIMNGCTSNIDLEFNHSHASKANLIYLRMTDNVFYNCGSSGSCLSVNYHPDQSGSYDPNVDNMDPSSKTYIARNNFYNIPSGCTPLKFNGANTIKTKEFKYKVSAIENRFVFAQDAGTAISCSIFGVLDASKNFIGTCVDGAGKEKALSNVDSALEVTTNTETVFSRPYYLDYAMTTLSANVSLEPGFEADVIAAGFEKNGVVVNNTDSEITGIVAPGVEQVDLSKIVKGNNVTYKVYKDFLLGREVKDGKLFITDDMTRAYIVATNNETKVTTKYSVALVADTNKALAELKEIVYTPEDEIYTNVVRNDKDITITLDTQYIYFPINLVVSPSASYKIFSDAECKNEYTGNWYMKPGDATVLYAQVTSGDTKVVNVYKLSFVRPGSDEYDARIISAESPEQNISIFNNDRKRVAYRPFIMADEVTFKFNVSDNATYTIYEKYENGVLSNPISTAAEPKSLKIADALSFYYVEVVSSFGFRQVYTLSMYNDVKSTDNKVYGVSGIEDATIENNVITIPASSTLSVVNALFDTDVFADVKLYADEAKTFAVAPSSTYKIVNKREVEVRTFQLGNSARTSYFYMVVTSESGVPNEYLVILKKQIELEPVEFADVSANHWAKSYIDKASAIGLVSGQQDINNGKYYFMPYNKITRQEVATLLCTSLGIEPYSFRGVVLSTAFSDSNDIPEWSYNYVKAVYQLGAMVGSDGKFNHDKQITRQEFFSAIANMFDLDIEGAKDYDLSKFSDNNKVASWALDATKAVVKAGIVEGSNGKLNPTDFITRAEVATIISQCHKLNK